MKLLEEIVAIFLVFILLISGFTNDPLPLFTEYLIIASLTLNVFID